MNIRDGLPAARLAEFQHAISRVPKKQNGLELGFTDGLLTDWQTTETLALALLVFGSPDAAREYLQKPTSRLDGKTPLACIKDSETTCEMVIEDLFRIIEGYVF
ncbi:antitoxin Xre/MbcA/ParS toxin-binding domain-containing protein [Pseudomonas saliphila]|uniref:antitoxin Xre/MbcA/ParS toxin-binding domain-containing protein n=1 Tax=Pseudomonas saliphila TaxID=2586906 RepID=UPI0015B42D3D|nr:antitoxin Xre/MbcA/ParS toxin-binding domain-containing protein [Pseudomonas saliphila]